MVARYKSPCSGIIPSSSEERAKRIAEKLRLCGVPAKWFPCKENWEVRFNLTEDCTVYEVRLYSGIEPQWPIYDVNYRRIS